MDGFISDFKNRIIDLYGSKGQKWLGELPSRVRTIEQRWQLEVSDPFKSLSYNYVVPAELQDGTEAILKLGFQSSALKQEAKSLLFFNGHGAAKLLKSSAKLGALLIQRVLPGNNIKQLDEPESVKAFVSVIRKLHRPVDAQYDFPTIHDWGDSFTRLRNKFNGNSGFMPSNLVDEAETLFKDLSNTMTAPVLLHGDLHHENILADSANSWTAIDPKGVVGEPEYEIGAFLRNPMSTLKSQENLVDLIANRINLLSEMTGYDQKRIARWGFAQAILSAIWILEDHGSDWENILKVARAIRVLYSA